MTKIVIVDRNDKLIGAKEKDIAIKNGLIHRIVRIFLFNSKGEVFLQKRSPNMKVWPNRWDQSVGGHVDEGETYNKAALREMKEELGIIKVNIKRILKYYQEEIYNGYLLKRFNVVYKAIYNERIKLNKEEISKGDWFEPDYLSKWMKKRPEDFATGCIIAFSKIHGS